MLPYLIGHGRGLFPKPWYDSHLLNVLSFKLKKKKKKTKKKNKKKKKKKKKHKKKTEK